MTIDLTRRTLLHLAGASSLGAAAVAAARAEGTAGSGGPTFANRTPMRIGMVTLRVRNLDLRRRLLSRCDRADRDAALATSARLGSGGVPLLELEWREGRRARRAMPRASITRRSWCRRGPTSRAGCSTWRQKRPAHRRLRPFRERGDLSRRPRGQRHRGVSRPGPGRMGMDRRDLKITTDQLDIDDLMAADGRESNSGAPDGMRIGHVHLRVGDLEQADAFYRDTIGLAGRGAAAAPRSCPRAATTITSRAMSGTAPAPDGAMIQPPGSRGFRCRSRQKSCRRSRSACVRRARRLLRSRTASRHQIPGARKCGWSKSDAGRHSRCTRAAHHGPSPRRQDGFHYQCARTAAGQHATRSGCVCGRRIWK